MSAERLHRPPDLGAMSPLLSRRHFLSAGANGIGSVALAWLLSREQARAGIPAPAPASSRPPRFAPKAKRVVQIFCCGGVSHIETFDHKPELVRMDGRSLEGKGENLGFFGQPARGVDEVAGVGKRRGGDQHQLGAQRPQRVHLLA